MRLKHSLMRPTTEEENRGMHDLPAHVYTHWVTQWAVAARLTPLELSVVAHLEQNPRRPVSAEELLNVVWKTSLAGGGTLSQVTSCIKRLRRKLERSGQSSYYVRSVRGWGYALDMAPRGSSGF